MTATPYRRARVLGYGLFAAAGVAAIVWPAPSVATATGWLAYLWAGWLAVGGAVAAAGAATDRWLGELAGLPLLVAAFGVYALVVAVAARSSPAGALVLAAVAAVLYARWRDVGQVRREAARLADRED